MKQISFHELYTLHFDICDVYCMSQKWIEGVTFRRERPRLTNGIL